MDAPVSAPNRVSPPRPVAVRNGMPRRSLGSDAIWRRSVLRLPNDDCGVWGGNLRHGPDCAILGGPGSVAVTAPSN